MVVKDIGALPLQCSVEKHYDSLVVVLLILAGDLATMGAVLLMLHHWFR